MPKDDLHILALNSNCLGLYFYSQVGEALQMLPCSYLSTGLITCRELSIVGGGLLPWCSSFLVCTLGVFSTVRLNPNRGNLTWDHGDRRKIKAGGVSKQALKFPLPWQRFLEAVILHSCVILCIIPRCIGPAWFDLGPPLSRKLGSGYESSHSSPPGNWFFRAWC